MIRDNKGKPQKGAKKSPDANALKGTSEKRLLSKLQEESLKVHGDPHWTLRRSRLKRRSKNSGNRKTYSRRVSPEWRDVGAVKLLIGTSNNPTTVENGSSVLEAEILDAIDDLGLWIEINGGQTKWPDRPAQKLMVPWKFVLAIVLQPDLKPHENKVGYETIEPVPT